MSTQRLSVYGLRRALIAGIQRVLAQRDELNRINVFPLADHDTGTNLAFTLGAVLQGLRTPRFASASELLHCAATEALDGARGNAGAIMAHFFQGAAEALPPGRPLTPAVLAQAVSGGSARAWEAMAEPCEGTMLSVIRAFAEEMLAQAGAGGRGNRECFQRALERAREALRRTPEQLKVLRVAGVVDAGGRGFVDLLEGMAQYIERGRGVVRDELPPEFLTAGVDAFEGSANVAARRYCVQCVVSAGTVDRTALRAALCELPLSRGIMAGSRDQVRLHAHLDDPAPFFATATRFGVVSRERSDDVLLPSPAVKARRQQVAIITDSGADLPPEEVDRLNIHLVPQRVSIGGRDFVDGVTISAHEFYGEMRTSPVPPRTSQPPPGDFRRMFEFLLSHHERVIDVSLTRNLSGTLQSAASAAARADPERVSVFDSHQVAGGQGLLAIWAAEAAQAGLDAPHILEGLARMRARTMLFGMVSDIRYVVRGGRVPRVALPVTRLLRVSLLLRIRPGGRLGLMGGLWGRGNLPERFARRIARQLDPARRYRLMVGHCDCAGDAERVRSALLASVRGVDHVWLVETSVAIGAHAGPGSLVIGVQDYEAARAMMLDAARIVLGYLLGSISGSLLLGRLRGVDIRQQGSGNAGGTNAFRTQGLWFGLGVAFVDVAKAAIAVWIGGYGMTDSGHALRVALLAGAAAAAGHVWPLYFGFRGGKGVAAVFGVLLVLWPAGLAVMLGVILLVLTTTGFVGLGSMLAGVALIPAAALFAPAPNRVVWIVAAVVIAAFILFTHRSNLRRLLAGTEHRFERARVLARLFSK